MDITDVPVSLMTSITKKLIEEGILDEDGKKKSEKITINPELHTNNSSVTNGVHASDQSGQSASGDSVNSSGQK